MNFLDNMDWMDHLIVNSIKCSFLLICDKTELKTLDVAIVSGIFFNYGQCHTFIPKKATRQSWKNHGYSLILTHTMEATDETNSENSPGWHIFIHEPKETFTGKLNSISIIIFQH